MIYIFAGPRNESGPMGTEAICAIAKRHNVPVFVDAAAEILTIPNIHLQRGATLVGYSGGKFIRGPQSAGLLLGRKDLVQAAWIHSAPHHGFGRSMKVGREEMVGMLVAVESWVARDHEAEWKQWVARVQHVADRVSGIPGVTATVNSEPGGRSNRSPSVAIRWDSQRLGLTGQDVVRILDTTDPRILLSAARRWRRQHHGGSGQHRRVAGAVDHGAGRRASRCQPVASSADRGPYAASTRTCCRSRPRTCRADGPSPFSTWPARPPTKRRSCRTATASPAATAATTSRVTSREPSTATV